MSTPLQIVNVAQRALGQAPIKDYDDTDDPQAVAMKAVFDARNEAVQSRDWNFNRTRAMLTRVHQLTLDTAPEPASFSLGATLTGATSQVTCTVKKVISSTVYWVTAPSGEFTDGEVISDGTNSVDCAAGYPDMDTTPPAFGSWQYCFAIPTDCVNLLGLIDEHLDAARYPHRIEGNFIFSNQSKAFLRYNRLISDVSEITRGWYGDLLGKDLAMTCVTEFVGKDPYLGLRVQKLLDQAWLDALSANGREEYYETPLGEANGSTKVYLGMRHLP